MNWHIVRQVRQGQMIPRFFGSYRVDWYNDTLKVALFPFNIYLGLCFMLWSNLINCWRPMVSSTRDAFEQGKAAKEGYWERCAVVLAMYFIGVMMGAML